MKKEMCFIMFAALLVNLSLGETVYFLVSDPNSSTESFVVPISDPLDVAHAYDLIENGLSAGNAIVCAAITCRPDGINRDYLAPFKPAWNWHVTEFEGFAGATIELLDGSPSLVEADCAGWVGDTGGHIGFWSYTIVAELGTDPDWFQCNFSRDRIVNLYDFVRLADYWLGDGCQWPDYCQGADTNKDGVVDLMDLRYCMGFWQITWPEPPLWFQEWNCPTQCYGNADCESEGGFMQPKYPVGNIDLNMLLAAWPLPVYYQDGTGRYNPAVDFDRDLDVDDDDTVILGAWFRVPEDEVPTDCEILEDMPSTEP